MTQVKFMVLLMMVLFIGGGILVTGCCDCHEPVAPVEPPHPLLGSWSCFYAILQDSPFDQALGMEVTFRSDGTMDSPMFTGSEDTYTWFEVDDRLTVDNGEMAFGMFYNIDSTVGDTLTWSSGPTGPFVLMTFEYRFIRL